jgi:hypothetical protein
MSEIVKQDIAPAMSEAAHFDLVVKQADILSKSSIVPRAYRGQAADIIAAGLAGRAFNWDTMTSMRNYHVIEGSASLRPEAMLGLVRLHGHSVDFRDEPDAVVAIGTRQDTGDTYEARFSIADAQAAGLANKRNWKQYQNAMLTWRAVSKLCRYLFSDVVLGAGYTPEEIGANTNADGDVVEIEVIDTDTSHVKDVDPFLLEGDGWLSAAQAKTELLEACAGDKELAQRIWGDKGSEDMHTASLEALVKQAVEVLDSDLQQEESKQTEQQTDEEVVAEEVEMF